MPRKLLLVKCRVSHSLMKIDVFDRFSPFDDPMRIGHIPLIGAATLIWDVLYKWKMQKQRPA